MVIKLYISSVSGNKEVKKRQMKATLILESKGVEFQTIDISDPGRQDDRKFMQANAKAKANARNPIPPQFFNEEEYCGEYEGFDEANETDTLEDFLKLPRGTLPQVPIINHDINGLNSREVSLEPELAETLAKNVTPRLAAQTLQEAKTTEENDEEAEEKTKLKDEENGNGWGEEGGKGTWRDLGGGTDDQDLDVESEIQPANQSLTSSQPGFDNKNRTGGATSDDDTAQGQDDQEKEDEEEEEEEEEEEHGMEEMSTTVATSDQFLEFSYKQVQGED